MGDNNPYASITDMNDLPLGNYTFWLGVNRNIDNYPPCTHTSGSVRSFVQVITQQTDGFRYQRVINVFYDNNNKMEIFERIKKGSAVSWGDWYRTDNYGTSSLSELASALGAFTINGAGITPDQVTKSGITRNGGYKLSLANGTTYNNTYGICKTYMVATDSTMTNIYFEQQYTNFDGNNGGGLYYRSFASNTGIPSDLSQYKWKLIS